MGLGKDGRGVGRGHLDGTFSSEKNLTIPYVCLCQKQDYC